VSIAAFTAAVRTTAQTAGLGDVVEGDLVTVDFDTPQPVKAETH